MCLGLITSTGCGGKRAARGLIAGAVTLTSKTHKHTHTLKHKPILSAHPYLCSSSIQNTQVDLEDTVQFESSPSVLD